MERAAFLERLGYTLILFSSITIVTAIAFVFLAVVSFVEPVYSVPEITGSMAPVLGIATAALVAGTVALVAGKAMR